MDEFSGLLVAGIDEAGRGPIAGPVVASAVILPEGFEHSGIRDSKVMSGVELAEMEEVIKGVAVGWSVVEVDERTIERQNILQATFLAMNRAVEGLVEGGEGGVPDLLLVDGNRFRSMGTIEYRTVVGGDSKYQCISAASILAKTHRDRVMRRLHTNFPHYGWDTNMGYPTPQHLEAVKQWGVTQHHRRTFRGVREYINDELF